GPEGPIGVAGPKGDPGEPGKTGPPGVAYVPTPANCYSKTLANNYSGPFHVLNECNDKEREFLFIDSARALPLGDFVVFMTGKLYSYDATEMTPVGVSYYFGSTSADGVYAVTGKIVCCKRPAA